MPDADDLVAVCKEILEVDWITRQNKRLFRRMREAVMRLEGQELDPKYTWLEGKEV